MGLDMMSVHAATSTSLLHLVLLRFLEVVVLIFVFVVHVAGFFRLLVGFGPVDVLASGAAADDVVGVDFLHVVFVFFLCCGGFSFFGGVQGGWR